MGMVVLQFFSARDNSRGFDPISQGFPQKANSRQLTADGQQFE